MGIRIASAVAVLNRIPSLKRQPQGYCVNPETINSVDMETAIARMETASTE